MKIKQLYRYLLTILLLALAVTANADHNNNLNFDFVVLRLNDLSGYQLALYWHPLETLNARQKPAPSNTLTTNYQQCYGLNDPDAMTSINTVNFHLARPGESQPVWSLQLNNKTGSGLRDYQRGVAITSAMPRDVPLVLSISAKFSHTGTNEDGQSFTDNDFDCTIDIVNDEVGFVPFSDIRRLQAFDASADTSYRASAHAPAGQGTVRHFRLPPPTRSVVLNLDVGLTDDNGGVLISWDRPLVEQPDNVATIPDSAFFYSIDRRQVSAGDGFTQLFDSRNFPRHTLDDYDSNRLVFTDTSIIPTNHEFEYRVFAHNLYGTSDPVTETLSVAEGRDFAFKQISGVTILSPHDGNTAATYDLQASQPGNPVNYLLKPSLDLDSVIQFAHYDFEWTSQPPLEILNRNQALTTGVAPELSTPGTEMLVTHTFRMTARANPQITASASAVFRFLAPPAQPQNVKISRDANNNWILSWDEADGATRYDIDSDSAP